MHPMSLWYMPSESDDQNRPSQHTDCEVKSEDYSVGGSYRVYWWHSSHEASNFGELDCTESLRSKCGRSCYHDWLGEDSFQQWVVHLQKEKNQLKKHRGQGFSLILGQFTQLMQDKMKQDTEWNVVSTSYDPMTLWPCIGWLKRLSWGRLRTNILSYQCTTRSLASTHSDNILCPTRSITSGWTKR